jgi:DNA-binding SARP family transcriptional activator
VATAVPDRPQRPAGAAGPELMVLGGWRLRINGELVGFPKREQRLLALLAVRGGGTREYVAGTLWPESSQQHSLGNLRSAVWQVQHRTSGLLRADRSEIALGAEVRTDVEAVLAACRWRRPGIGSVAPDDVMELLTRGPLLPGWEDGWAVAERERLRNRQLDTLLRMAQDALRRGDNRLAVAAGVAASLVDPLSEDAVQTLAVARRVGASIAPRLHHDPVRQEQLRRSRPVVRPRS